MAKITLIKPENRLEFLADDGKVTAFECRTDIWPGKNEYGQDRAPLPAGNYTASVALDYAGDDPAFGPGFVNVDRERGRGWHGGGSDLPDPFAPRQGWEATYGCGRLQNEDVLALKEQIIAAGNAVETEVIGDDE